MSWPRVNAKGRAAAIELEAWWLQRLWLAQATNDLDAGAYSHGVFDWDPAVPRPSPR